MRTSSLPNKKRQQNAYQQKKELNLESNGRQRLEKVCWRKKKILYAIGGIPTNSNAQKLKRSQNELTN